MPEFQVSYEIARNLSRSRYGTAGAEFSRAMQAYSPPVHRNGQQTFEDAISITAARYSGSR